MSLVFQENPKNGQNKNTSGDPKGNQHMYPMETLVFDKLLRI